MLPHLCFLLEDRSNLQPRKNRKSFWKNSLCDQTDNSVREKSNNYSDYPTTKHICRIMDTNKNPRNTYQKRYQEHNFIFPEKQKNQHNPHHTIY